MALWKLDPAHSKSDFSVRHMMVTTVRGSLPVADGTINFDPANPAAASVEVILDAAAISTSIADRDNHLRSPDFLDVANHPHISFKSTKVEVTGENTGKITGDLTIRGVSKPVVLEAEFLGQQKNPFTQAHTVGFTASTKINREDWGLTWNVALEAGGVLVGKEIKIEIDAEATQA
jgi:polyisoprenoid-binding protein YceI